MEFDIELGIFEGYVALGLEQSRTVSKTLFKLSLK